MTFDTKNTKYDPVALAALFAVCVGLGISFLEKPYTWNLCFQWAVIISPALFCVIVLVVRNRLINKKGESNEIIEPSSPDQSNGFSMGNHCDAELDEIMREIVREKNNPASISRESMREFWMNIDNDYTVLIEELTELEKWCSKLKCPGCSRCNSYGECIEKVKDRRRDARFMVNHNFDNAQQFDDSLTRHELNFGMGQDAMQAVSK